MDLSREKLQAEMVQPTGPEDQQETIQRSGGGEVAGSSQGLREQVGFDCQAFPRQNGQCSQESLACRHGKEAERAAAAGAELCLEEEEAVA